MLVSALHGYHIVDVSCGSGDAHSLALADDGMYLNILYAHCLIGFGKTINIALLDS